MEGRKPEEMEREKGEEEWDEDIQFVGTEPEPSQTFKPTNAA